ncbi:MAG: hypothetical protein ACRDK7_14390 [Solirubrobacteraceae bacterium]
MRGTYICLVLCGLAACALPSAATAAPSVTMFAKAVPIPGVRGTGNILGAGAALQAKFTIAGTEYGGFPPPLTEVKFYGPHGAKVHSRGFATCSLRTLEQSGPRRCPRKSHAGPKGSASGIVSFGTERVHETVSVQPFFAPGGDLEFFVDGVTPVSIEIISKGRIVNSAAPYGPEVVATVPLIESVPGALDASALEINVKVGASYKKKGGKRVYYIRVPRRCPRGGFPLKAELGFLGGAVSSASYKAPCPKRRGGRSGQRSRRR